MKVIFLEDDRIDDVSEGYARNYLLPRKLAVPANAPALAAAEKRKEKKMAELGQKRTDMQLLAEKLASMEFEVKADTGEGGKLFGSVTSSDIAEAVKRTAGVEFDRKKIELNEPLKIVGDYTVSAKLFQDVTATLRVKVTPK
jgi:large subunit ribosomal protein L9